MATNRGQVWLYCHSSMEAVAAEVERRCSSTASACVTEEYEQRKQAYERHILVKESRSVKFQKTVQWKKFKDGFPNLFIENVKEMAGKDVLFLASFHSPDVIFEQLSVIFAMPRYLARSFTVILPYFPTGTMERVDQEGQIATAKTLATLLSSTPMTARGPAQILIFDIHALQERFYFTDSVIPRLESAIALLHRELKSLPTVNEISIAFPDDGAFKRFSSMFPQHQTIVCAKVRDGNNRIVTVKDGDPAGQHVVIVDDLVQTGGTLIECAKALMKKGASSVSAYVTHAVFPSDSWKRFTECEVEFSTFWITDSVPHAREIAKHPPFKLLSLADIIADTLLGFDLLQ